VQTKEYDPASGSSLLGSKDSIYKRIGYKLDSAIKTDLYPKAKEETVHISLGHQDMRPIKRNSVAQPEGNTAVAPAQIEATAEVATFDRSEFNPYLGVKSPHDLIKAQVQNMRAINSAGESDFKYVYEQQQPWDPTMERDEAAKHKADSDKADRLMSRLAYQDAQESLIKAQEAQKNLAAQLKQQQAALKHNDEILQSVIENRQDLKPRAKTPKTAHPGPARKVAMLPRENVAAEKILEEQRRNMAKYSWTNQDDVEDQLEEEIEKAEATSILESIAKKEIHEISPETKKVVEQYTTTNDVAEDDMPALERQILQRQAMMQQQKKLQEMAYQAVLAEQSEEKTEKTDVEAEAENPRKPKPFSKPMIRMSVPDKEDVEIEDTPVASSLIDASESEKTVEITKLSSKTNACGNQHWQPNTTYEGEQVVEFNEELYKCSWWTANTSPADQPDVWARVGKCACNGISSWTLTGNYRSNDLVEYGNAIYKARGDNFGRDPIGFSEYWDPVSSCLVATEDIDDVMNLLASAGSDVTYEVSGDAPQGAVEINGVEYVPVTELAQGKLYA
jgi:chitodextrinase